MGCEELDITEIPGADSLYEAAGIIAESEANASGLFGCPTFYSTEGSSHCIRAMLLLAKAFPPGGRCHPALPASRMTDEGHTDARFRVLAARNVHRAFLSAAALLDLDVCWLPPADGSYLSAAVTPEALDRALAETGARAVYLTCPDYLGDLPDLRPLAEVCHAHGALLLVDNAHGAYLRFLNPSRHPMDLGADLCCDSAHKTLPVLTGGAYLHLAKGTGNRQWTADVRDALALFGSTSPSYLILQSLDLANPFLEQLPDLLAVLIPKLDAVKRELTGLGYRLYEQEPLKLTLDLRAAGALPERPPEAQTCRNGKDLAAALEQEGIFCEFADPDFVVFMLTPNTTDAELARLLAALRKFAPVDQPKQENNVNGQRSTVNCQLHTVCSIRTAMLSPCVRVPVEESLGRVLARPGVSCPPAVPIRMPGERIDEAALAAFRSYGIQTCEILISGGTQT